MDLEKHNNGSKFNIGFSMRKKNRGKNRFLYEAEVEVIKRQIGDLETIRKSLGFSQRKICQLLMVDPSAWTRWQKTNQVPPHIYRSLSWYLMAIEKSPLDHKPNYETLKAQMDMVIGELEKSRTQIRLLKSRFIFSLMGASAVVILMTIGILFY